MQNGWDRGKKIALWKHKVEFVAKTEARIGYFNEIYVTGNNDSYTYNLKCTYGKIKLAWV